MSATPSPSRLTEAYFRRQLERTLATLNRIMARDPVGPGRVVPNAEALAIHDGRRLEAAVLFLDICKFSQRPSWTPEEQQTMLQILSLLFSELIKIVEDYGGVVEKNTGDGLMAYFSGGAGQAVSAQQTAVAAALTMFSAKDRLINPILAQSGLQIIDFRICIDHGPITVANVGVANGFKGIVAIGTTANIASKMLAVADANTILVGEKVLDGLPTDWWRDFSTFKTGDTGWSYRDDGRPYCYWQYNGRWNDPL